MRRIVMFVAVLTATTLVTLHARRAPDVAWPQFRGPAGAGILDSAALPTAWSATSNIAWNI